MRREEEPGNPAGTMPTGPRPEDSREPAAESARPVLIRPGHQGDLRALGDLWQELMDFHARLDARYRTTPEAREIYLRHLGNDVLRSRDSILLVAEVDGVVVGFLVGKIERGVAIYEEPDFGYIIDACVSDGYRRMGIGQRLFQSMREFFRRRGLSNIRVSVASNNPVSCAFWKDMGFRPFMERWWLDI